MTNPQVATCYLGTNARVLVDGTVDCEKLHAETNITTRKVNGVDVVRSLHIAQTPTKDYSMDICAQADRLTRLDRRTATNISLSKDYSGELADQADRTSSAQRSCNKQPVISKNWATEHADTRNEVMRVKREAQQMPSLSKDYGSQIARIAGMQTKRDVKQPSLTKDFSEMIAQQGDRCSAIEHRIPKPALSKSYDASR